MLDELARTRREVLSLLQQDEMLARKPHLHTAVRLRRPFVDMLSHLQLRGLSEVRAHGEEEAAGWKRPLLLTINGLRDSGRRDYGRRDFGSLATTRA